MSLILLTFLLVLVVHIDTRVVESRDVDVGGLLISSLLLTFSFDGLVCLRSFSLPIFATVIRIINDG